MIGTDATQFHLDLIRIGKEKVKLRKEKEKPWQSYNNTSLISPLPTGNEHIHLDLWL
jgi:hypothetical protein